MPPKIYISNQHFPKKKRKNLLRFLMKSFRNDLQPLIIGNKLFILNAAVSPYIAVGVGYGYVRVKQAMGEVKYRNEEVASNYTYTLPALADMHDIYGQVGLGGMFKIAGPFFAAVETYCGSHHTPQYQQRENLLDGGLSLMLGMQMPQKIKIAVGGGVNLQKMATKTLSVVENEDSEIRDGYLTLRENKCSLVRYMPSGAINLWVMRDLGRQFSLRLEGQILFSRKQEMSNLKFYDATMGDYQGVNSNLSAMLVQFRTQLSLMRSI